MDGDILPPNHIKERPCLDLRSIALSSGDHLSDLTDEEDENLCHVNVLKEFPTLPKSGMDDSQLAACKRMLTQSLAIVQVRCYFSSFSILLVHRSLNRSNPRQ